MNRKSVVLGTFFYAGLLVLTEVFLCAVPLGIPIPSLWSWLLWPVAIIFCGALLLRSRDRGSLKSFSVAVSCLYLLSCIVSYYCLMEGMVFLVFSGFFGAVWLITACGVWVAGRGLSRWGLTKARKIFTRSACIILAIAFLGPYLYNTGYAMVSGIRNSALTDAVLQCNANELTATKVVPDLHAPIAGETNLIWCAPFQLAWTELADFVGEDIRFGENEPECVLHLNQRSVGKEQLDSETCFAAAGAYTPDFIRKVNSEVQSKLGSGVFKPETIPETGGPDRLAAFGYLSINLPFEYAFERDDRPLDFQGVPVQAFYGEGSEILENLAKRQVRVCYPPEKGEFVVELKTKKTDHQLILAKIAPGATLAETVDKVIGYVDSLSQEYLEPNQELVVPIFNFNITREYDELIGNALVVRNPAYRGWRITKAEQNIRLQLDERGAGLQSSAFAELSKCIPRHCIFDGPFLLLLRYKNSAQPCFAMWVDNAELLVKSE
ncbi:MAG: hypothetical protein MUC65_07585 [Pontiellaceae bacterium]|nr:hypothetical protein [Pontiellaceae bacterium]